MKPENDWLAKSKRYKDKLFNAYGQLYGDASAKVQVPETKVRRRLRGDSAPIPTEAAEQRALVSWIRTQPKIAPYIIKLNNEGQRTRAQGFNLKMLGMQPGASDLFLAYPVKPYYGLWIEIKRNRSYSPSEMRSSSWEAQVAFLGHMKSVGYAGKICYGFEHGKRIIESYLNGTLSHDL